MPTSDTSGVRARLAARAGRRLAAFGLLGAVLTLEFAWLQTLGAVNCSLRKVNGEYCLLLGVPEAVAYAALALPVGVVGLLGGLLVPPAWTAAARETRPGRLAFAPSNGTLLALLPVLAAAGGGGLLLFFGEVTARAELWLGEATAAGGGPVAVLGVLLVVVAATVAQVL